MDHTAQYSGFSRRRYWLRLVAFTAGSLSLGLGLLLAWAVKIQIDVLVAPKRVTYTKTPAEIGLAYEDVTLTTADRLELAGWYIPGHRPYGVVLAHGIQANREAVLPEAGVLARAGYHLLLVDLRGHGHSQGDVITYGYREALDVQAAADYLLAVPGVERVAALGTSLGGAAVARAAATDPRLAAVIIESSYSSLPAAVEDAFDDFTIFPKWPFAPLIIGLAEARVGVNISQVDSARDLAGLSPRPVLIIHGQTDGLFPPYHAQAMYDAARPPKEIWLVERWGHGYPDFIGREEEFERRVVTFLERAFAAQAPE